jgi:endoglucanase Acf2
MVREANKDRLEQLLREVQHKSDDDRYVAALE